MSIESTILDNSDNHKMVDKLKELIHLDGIDTIRIATGYWDLPGLMLVADDLKYFFEKSPNNKLKLIIGKDAYVYADMMKNALYKDASYPADFIRIDLDTLAKDIKDEHINAVNLLMDYCDESKNQIEIKIFKTNDEDEKQFFHSKCYIFTKGVDEKGIGIIGSSNFTKRGLELNSELNYLERDALIVCYNNPQGTRKGHVGWFNEKWDLADEWTKEFLEQVLKKSKIGNVINKREKPQEPEPTSENLTPYETYIKYLQTQFGDIANAKQSELIKSYLPNTYDKFDYQIDAVKQCCFYMHQYGGFILADVVGLGKTIVGCLVVKQFLNEAGKYNRKPLVLIITPPAVQESWQNTCNDFGLGDGPIDFITTGKLFTDEDGNEVSQESQDFNSSLIYKDYGLILIDESHGFRNADTNKYKTLNNLISKITTTTGQQPFMALLSATPQNNCPNDLKNQIQLFQRNANASNLPGIPNGRLETFFANAQKIYDTIRKHSRTDIGIQILNKLSQKIRESVLNDLVVRRTRFDIKKYYQDADMFFPTIEGPSVIEYKLSKDAVNVFADTMEAIWPSIIKKPKLNEEKLKYIYDNFDAIMNGTVQLLHVDPPVKHERKFGYDEEKNLWFARYKAVGYLNDEYIPRYASRGKTIEEQRQVVDNAMENIGRIEQINLVKRLESSIDAFRESWHNLERNTQNMIDMWNDNKIFICPDLDVNAIFAKFRKDNPNKNDKDIRAMVYVYLNEKSTKANAKKHNNIPVNCCYCQDDFCYDLLSDLLIDLKLIQKLGLSWEKIHEDRKLDKFRALLLTKFFDKDINNPSGTYKQRLVIFTEAKTTAKILESAINSICENKHKVLVISAENRNEKAKVIKENFDAKYDKDKMKDDFDIIITTEVLAEGVNLHRSNVIVNYDTPWNSTRLMQRIGRVNRIGSVEEKVYVFNFMPSAEGDQEIQIMSIAHSKLQAFHSMFGEDNQVFTQDETVSHHNLHQSIEEGESPFVQFVNDLKEYQKQNPERYEFITQKEFKNIFGQCSLGKIFDKDNNEIDVKAISICGAERHSLMGIYFDSESKANAVSNIRLMQLLRVDQNASYSLPKQETLNDINSRAKTYFSVQSRKSTQKKDFNKKIKDAYYFAIEIKNKIPASEVDAISLINMAMKAAKDGNPEVVESLLREKKNFENHQGSLFAPVEDLKIWLSQTFQFIQNKAASDYGEFFISLTQINA